MAPKTFVPAFDMKVDGCVFESYVDSVISTIKKVEHEVPKWLASVLNRFESVCAGSLNRMDVESSVFDVTDACFSNLNISTNPFYEKDSLILPKTKNQAILSCIAEESEELDDLPKPSALSEGLGNTKTNKNNNGNLKTANSKKNGSKKQEKFICDKVNKKPMPTSFLNNTKPCNKSQIKKVKREISVVNSNESSMAKHGKFDSFQDYSTREKHQKCENAENYKWSKLQAKKEEIKAKNLSRMNANKERRIQAEQERMKKLNREEIRKRICKEQIESASKKYTKSQTKKENVFTPLKLKNYPNIHNLESKMRSTNSKVTSSTPFGIANEKWFSKSSKNGLLDDIFCHVSPIKHNDLKDNSSKKLNDNDLSTATYEGVKKCAAVDDSATADTHNNIRKTIEIVVKEESINKNVKAGNKEAIDSHKYNEKNIGLKENFNDKSTVAQYEMTIIDSENCSGDSQYYIEYVDNNKPIPEWASDENLCKILEYQFENSKIDPDKLFGPIPRVNLNEIFKDSKQDFTHRNSTGYWHDDS